MPHYGNSLLIACELFSNIEKNEEETRLKRKPGYIEALGVSKIKQCRLIFPTAKYKRLVTKLIHDYKSTIKYSLRKDYEWKHISCNGTNMLVFYRKMHE